ncbi:MAG TPA: hypothetical protein PLY93_14465 [Turneriella sp.]|nr:hypothetical protein [Turneriella sp.]
MLRKYLPQLFILSTAALLAIVGYVLVDLNKNSLGVVSITTYIGIVVMAVAMKIAGYLLGDKVPHANGKKYGDVMDWAMLLFVWPSYVTPLVVVPHLVGHTLPIFALFIVGIGLFATLSLVGLQISANRINGKRRYATWLYFIPAFLYIIPALIIGYFIVGKFSTSLTVMRFANIGGLLLGAFFSFYCVKIANSDLFDYDNRRYRFFDLAPLFFVVIAVAIIAEFALPLFQGRAHEMYLLYTMELYTLIVAQVLGVLSVTRRAKF